MRGLDPARARSGRHERFRPRACALLGSRKVLFRGTVMKSTLIALTTATLVALGSGLTLPVATFAADTDTHTRDLDTQAVELAAQAKEMTAQAKEMTAQSAEQAKDMDTRDLEAKLADARARLEEAAHEVAELSSQVGGEWVDKFMVFNNEFPPKAVIGVQLEDGKEGARIQEVSPGGPAEEAGLHVGDVITAINGTDVKGEHAARQVMHLMRKVAPESKVNVRVTREGKSRDFVVTARPGPTFLGMREPFVTPLPPLAPGAPNVHFRAFGPVMIHGPLGDMELATLTPQLGRYFGTDKGVLVVRAPKDFKLEDGDVILAVDGREPTSGSHATRILASYQPGEKVSIKIMRQQKTMNLETTLPDRQADLTPGPDGAERGHTTRMIPHKIIGATM
jgi:PDZ domain